MDGIDDTPDSVVINDTPNFDLGLDAQTTDFLLDGISQAIANHKIDPLDFIPADDSVTHLADTHSRFDSGVFTVGDRGVVGIDFLLDGGLFEGELAIFSLEGMDHFEPGSQAFIQEAAHRALSDSVLGHVAIADRTEGARFSDTSDPLVNFNTGKYLGVKSFAMRPGDEFGVMLVPNGTVQDVLNNPAVQGSKRPLFSMATANPDDGFLAGQIVDVNGFHDTFAFEDQRIDLGSDGDYNDFVFQVRGAKGNAVLLNQMIDPAKDWRGSQLGQELLDYTVVNSIADRLVAEGLPDSSVDDAGVAHNLVNHGYGVAHNLDVDNGHGIVDFPSHGGKDTQQAIESPTDNHQVLVQDSTRGESAVVEAPSNNGKEVVEVPSKPVQQVESSSSNQPLVGIIDTGFSGESAALDDKRVILGRDRVDNDTNPLLAAGEGDNHGTAILGAIAAAVGAVGTTQDNRPDAPSLWLGRGVGSGSWAESLVEFVDAAKRSGQRNAVINLSFDLTQVNPDGSVTTRYELTPEEWAALRYAQQNGVLIVAAAGNQGGAISALGQASREFDNIISVGAADGLERADYSSYGSGLDILAPGGTAGNSGTSLAAANVTGAVSQVWAANPGLSYRQVIDILKSTATDLETPGWDAETGAGLLNVPAAISRAKTTIPKHHTPRLVNKQPKQTWSSKGGAKPAERAAGWWDTAKNAVKKYGHTALDVAGFIPVVGAVADGANAVWYAAEGDYANAALSAISAVPGVGDAAGAAIKAGKAAAKVTKAAKGAKATKAAKAAPKPKPKPKTKSQSAPKPKPKAKSQSAPKPKPKTKTKPKSQSAPKPKPKTKTKPKSQSTPKSKPKPKTKSKSQSAPKSKPKTKSQGTKPKANTLTNKAKNLVNRFGKKLRSAYNSLKRLSRLLRERFSKVNWRDDTGSIGRSGRGNNPPTGNPPSGNTPSMRQPPGGKRPLSSKPKPKTGTSVPSRGTAGNPRASVRDQARRRRPQPKTPSPWRGNPLIQDGNLKEGWLHIEARHITGTHPKGAGDLFARGTNRVQLQRAARQIVKRGTRISDPNTRIQTFETRMTINGKFDRVRLVVDTRDGRIITIHPVRGGKT